MTRPAVRVLHLAKFPPGTPGGIERFVEQLVRQQRRCGVEAEVFACSDSRAAAGAVPPDIPTRLVTSLGQVLYLPIAPAYPFALARAIRAFRPDVLHIQWPNPLALAALLVPSARRCRWLVQWQADIVVEGGPRAVAAIYRPFAWMERAMLRRAHAVLASSMAYRDASASLRVAAPHAQVVPLGLDFDLTPASDGSARWSADAVLRVLCVARLVPYKGIEVLLRALAQVPQIALTVVGDGPLRARLADHAAAPDLAGRVHFTGRIDDAALESWLQSCDIACLPSINRHEAFGMTLLEAARAGKPAIATRVAGAGMAEVMVGLGCGWLVAPNDVEALAAALRDAAAKKRAGTLRGPDPAYRERFGIARIEREIARCYG